MKKAILALSTVFTATLSFAAPVGTIEEALNCGRSAKSSLRCEQVVPAGQAPKAWVQLCRAQEQKLNEAPLTVVFAKKLSTENAFQREEGRLKDVAASGVLTYLEPRRKIYDEGSRQEYLFSDFILAPAKAGEAYTHDFSSALHYLIRDLDIDTGRPVEKDMVINSGIEYLKMNCR